MIRPLRLLATALLTTCTLAACGDKAPADSPSAKSDAPASAAAASAPASAAPKAPTYSKAEAAKLLEQVNGCKYDFDCDAFKPLLGFGDQAHADIIAFVEDKTKSEKGRKVALQLLVKGKAAAMAERVYAVAKSIEGFDRGDYYKAVGALGAGNAKLFEQLKAELLAEKSSIKSIPIRNALEGMPTLAMTWITADFGKEPKAETRLASLVGAVAKAEHLAAVKAMLGKATDQMAKHRLAVAAIKLGDKGHFNVFVEGLQATNQYDRSDAANFLAKVAKEAPADLKAKLIELLKAAQAKDRGGLTSRGYTKSLKILGAQ